MGKIDDEYEPSPNPTPLGESAASISLHSEATTTSHFTHQPVTRYFDDDPAEIDEQDLPPLYSDVGHEPSTQNAIFDPLADPNSPSLGISPFATDKKNITYYVDPRLDNDPEFLEESLRALATIPPRPFVHIIGHHKEKHMNGDKTERKKVTDFDLEIELTHLLYEDIHRRKNWSELVTSDNFSKVHRGTVFPTRAPGFGGRGVADPESGRGPPTLTEWCHRYCGSHAGLKDFILQREVTGWNFDHLRAKLESMIRETNYKGHLEITFPVRNSRVDIYNNCRTNRWRLTKWIEMIFVFTLLFLFAWPYLFFRTKKWNTVMVTWPLSRPNSAGRVDYVSLSEDRWYNLWARTIHKAVLAKRQGLLTEQDVATASMPQQREEGWVGTVQAGVEAMGLVNRSFGWGGDSY